VAESNPRRPFDERAVLAELERLHKAILDIREQREQTTAEFDAFVRAFRDPEASAAPAMAPAPPPRALPATNVEPPVTTVGAAPPAPVRSDSAAADFESPRSEEVQQPSGLKYVAAAAVIGAVVVAGLLFVRSDRTHSPEPSAPPPAQSAPVAAPPIPAPSAASPAPTTTAAAPPPAHAVRIELTTVRPVWLRIMIDDRKTMERVVEAGQRIPLEGDHVISIRAGDGGAVRVTVGGNDGPMGPEGQPVTRTFPPSASRVAK
jgi:hypothetical protein